MHTLNYADKVNIENILNAEGKTYIAPKNGFITISCVNMPEGNLDYDIEHSGVAERLLCPDGNGYVPFKITIPVNKNEKLTVRSCRNVKLLTNSWFIPYKL